MAIVDATTPLRMTFGARLRVLFGALFFVAQGALIATAGLRPDHAYGFWMFHESSTVELRLFRTVIAKEDRTYRRVEATGPRGEWQARDGTGVLQTRSWRDRVKQPELGTFGVRFPASYGAQAVIARVNAALTELSDHVEDEDTCRFEVDVAVVHNGRDEGVRALRGPWRCNGDPQP